MPSGTRIPFESVVAEMDVPRACAFDTIQRYRAEVGAVVRKVYGVAKAVRLGTEAFDRAAKK